MKRPAHFMLRVTRLGPLVPARIWLCDHEPDAPENKLDRGRLSIFPRADIGGLEVDPEQLVDRLWSHQNWQPGYPASHWKYAQPITETEYRYRLQRIRWAEQHQRNDPTLRPRQAVDKKDFPLPDFSRENSIVSDAG